MNRYKSIIFITVGIIAGLIGWGAYYQLAFFSTGTTPKDGSKESTASDIRISFNKRPADSTVNNFTINPIVPGRVTIINNDVVFKPTTILNLNTKYTVLLKKPTSQTGQKNKDIKFEFTAVFVPFNQQSTKNQKLAIEDSNSLEKAYPIVEYLPYDNSHFGITYSLQADGKLKISIVLYAILNRVEQLDAYKLQLQQYKSEALKYLKSKDNNLEKYIIIFSPDPNTGLAPTATPDIPGLPFD